MDRREKIVYKCDLNGRGLEIGPSLRPVVPKRDGYNVETIDHTDKKGLQEKYAAQGHNVEDIEEVDYIWNGEPYTELTGKTDYYDYIIASHVIEHTCDLIGFFNDCSAMLKENGILSVVIPDKRYCFDYLRPVTSISQVIDSHLNRSLVHSPGSIYEHMSSACKSSGDIAWIHPCLPVGLETIHDIDSAVKTYNEALDQTGYIDIHKWVFTKSTFELLIYDLNCLNLINLQINASFDTLGHEFYVSLVKQDSEFIPDDKIRFELVLRVLDELEPADINPALTAQVNILNEKVTDLKNQVNTLNNQISGIYGSATWKAGEKIQKLYRFFKFSP